MNPMATPEQTQTQVCYRHPRERDRGQLLQLRAPDLHRLHGLQRRRHQVPRVRRAADRAEDGPRPACARSPAGHGLHRDQRADRRSTSSSTSCRRPAAARSRTRQARSSRGATCGHTRSATASGGGSSRTRSCTGALIHLLFNMLMLWWFGRPLEGLLRAGPLPRCLLHRRSSPGSAGALVLRPRAATIGASGAVFGILGAGLVLERNRIDVFGGCALLIVIFNLAFSLCVSYISIGGHIGGLVGGVLAVLVLSRFGRGHAVYGRFDLIAAAGLLASASQASPSPTSASAGTPDARSPNTDGRRPERARDRRIRRGVHLRCAREPRPRPLRLRPRAADRPARRKRALERRPAWRRRSAGIQRRVRQPDPGTAASARRAEPDRQPRRPDEADSRAFPTSCTTSTSSATARPSSRARPTGRTTPGAARRTSSPSSHSRCARPRVRHRLRAALEHGQRRRERLRRSQSHPSRGKRVRAWFSPGHGEAMATRIAHRIKRAKSRIRISSPVITSGPVLGALAEVDLRRQGRCRRGRRRHADERRLPPVGAERERLVEDAADRPRARPSTVLG